MIIHVQIKEIWKIFQDLGNRPIVFIRFNSDSYQSGESDGMF
jgi:hypothetical protein